MDTPIAVPAAAAARAVASSPCGCAIAWSAVGATRIGMLSLCPTHMQCRQPVWWLLDNDHPPGGADRGTTPSIMVLSHACGLQTVLLGKAGAPCWLVGKMLEKTEETQHAQLCPAYTFRLDYLSGACDVMQLLL